MTLFIFCRWKLYEVRRIGNFGGLQRPKEMEPSSSEDNRPISSSNGLLAFLHSEAFLAIKGEVGISLS
jgi:hypothetical protein